MSTTTARAQEVLRTVEHQIEYHTRALTEATRALQSVAARAALAAEAIAAGKSFSNEFIFIQSKVDAVLEAKSHLDACWQQRQQLEYLLKKD